MTPRNSQRPRLILAVRVILFLLGIVLILAAGRVQSGSQPYVILFGLGSAMITSVIITFLTGAFGADVVSQLDEKLEFQRNTYETGLQEVWVERAGDDFFRQFSSARRVDLLYNTGKSTIRLYGSLLIEAIVKQGCDVRLLIADPANGVFRSEECKLGLCPGTNIAGEVKDTISNLDELLKLVSASGAPPRAGSFEVRTYVCAPTGSLVLIDGRTARHIPYLPYAHSTQVPVWDVTKDRGGELYAKYSDMFERVWKKSESVLRVEFGPQPKESRNTARIFS